MSKVVAFRVALSILSGRVDVGELGCSAREALGIGFDPKTSIAARNESLEIVENCVAQVILGGPDGCVGEIGR